MKHFKTIDLYVFAIGFFLGIGFYKLLLDFTI